MKERPCSAPPPALYCGCGFVTTATTWEESGAQLDEHLARGACRTWRQESDAAAQGIDPELVRQLAKQRALVPGHLLGCVCSPCHTPRPMSRGERLLAVAVVRADRFGAEQAARAITEET